jgi:hypothetical protein
MPGVARVCHEQDVAQCEQHTCEKKVCCHHGGNEGHVVQGRATSGSTRTFVNGHPILRVDDGGKHEKGTCCGKNEWRAARCLAQRNVYVEGKEIFAEGDITVHDETSDEGRILHGSENVLVG